MTKGLTIVEVAAMLPAVRNLASLSGALLLLASITMANHTSAQNPPTEGAADAPTETSPEPSAASEGEDAHQPDQEQVGALLDEEARTRFRLGSTLYRQGRFEDAAREFRAAYEVSHRPELLYNLYLVERDAGNTREAADALRTYLSDAADVPDRGLMEGRLAALDRQLAAAETRVDQDAHDEDTASDANGAAPDGSNESSNDRVVPIAPPPESPSRVLPIALMAGGGAVLAAGVVFAILAKGQYSDLNDSCDEVGICDYPGAQGDIDALKRDDLLADISFGVGGAAVAAGVLVWLLQGGGDAERAEGMPRVTAGCGADGCGLGLEGSF